MEILSSLTRGILNTKSSSLTRAYPRRQPIIVVRLKGVMLSVKISEFPEETLLG